ncbi:aromatic ring-hydroxylating oxygenase subunit alpha [Synechococcus sp. Tobar12-5m-g]|uniref:aromatic ring-hydroxylating oxygenase subunit alpha n=1 Tax=Synechococcus sp. Tobar12-5m-g TaxID=2823742 RepID=UPI0020CECFDC|nr:SRPBCC family protein [Synechococcus sp. Tobar12-5m-g]MCP9873079.1 Rieske 2Fe-2S domain-containing protein [Synechococcus sp. Cruz CV-v-12]
MDERQRSDWARSLSNPEAFANEQACFRPVWTVLCLTTDIPNDNDWIRCRLGGSSVFVQRFGTTIRGFENVCRHRFHPIRTKAKGSGLVRCAFHHWVYNQAGEAVGIPQCKKLFGVTPRELGARLEEIEIATCGFLIFGRFCRQITAGTGAARADESLEEYLAEAWPILQAIGQVTIPPHTACSSVRANWKLLYELTLEEYHLFAVHPSTFRMLFSVHPSSFGKAGYLDPDHAHYPRFGRHSAFFYKGQPGDLREMAESCQAGTYRPGGYRILQIFPNLLVNHYRVLQSWYVSITQYVPEAHDRTTVRSWYFPAPFPIDDRSWLHRVVRQITEPWLPFFVGPSLRRITGEDHAVCETMQPIAGLITEAPILGGEEQRIGWFREAYGDALLAVSNP